MTTGYYVVLWLSGTGVVETEKGIKNSQTILFFKHKVTKLQIESLMIILALMKTNQ